VFGRSPDNLCRLYSAFQRCDHAARWLYFVDASVVGLEVVAGDPLPLVVEVKDLQSLVGGDGSHPATIVIYARESDTHEIVAGKSEGEEESAYIPYATSWTRSSWPVEKWT
jgi:hypothetical protein